MPRQAFALGAHPVLEPGHERRDVSLPAGEADGCGRAVDHALEVEDRVDAGHRLEGDGRDRGRFLAAPAGRGDVGELEELAPGMGPAQRLDCLPGLPIFGVKVAEAGIGIGLEDTLPRREMRLRVLAAPVAGVAE